MKFTPGKKYKCTNSESPGYKLGQVYEAYKNQHGITCLRGSDGWEDPCSMLVSSFVEVGD